GTRDRARAGGVVASGRGSVEHAQAAGAAGSGCRAGPSGERGLQLEVEGRSRAADQIRDEQQQMAQIAFAPTSSRQILGTMNDFDRMLEPAPGQSLTSAALELAQAPCGPIGMDSPDRATVRLFANPSDTEH